MPIYEYVCDACGHAFDHLARTLADQATQCPQCGAKEVIKQLSTFSTKESGTPVPCASGACPAASSSAGGASPCCGGGCPL